MSRKNGSPQAGNTWAAVQKARCPPGRSSSHARRYLTAGSIQCQAVAANTKVEGGCSRRLPRLEGRFDDFHIREPGEILPAYGSQVGPDLHARDLKPPPGKRNRGFPSGTSDLRKPVASALVFRLNDGSVTVTNVASFTARYPARAADELGARAGISQRATSTTQTGPTANVIGRPDVVVNVVPRFAFRRDQRAR